MKKYIAFDIGGTNVKHGLILENGIIIESDSYDTNCNDYDIFILKILEIIKEYKYSYEISGVALSVPGFVNVETGVLEKAGAIVSLDGKNLKTILENSTKLPTEMENDANCVALAERINGNAVHCNNYICYTIGTGIGGGIVINGNIIHGHKFMAGEFGFMKINDNISDCLHLNSSMGGLISMYKKLKNIDPLITTKGEEIFFQAKQDETVNNLVQNWYKNIATSIYNLVVTLNPEKILIGGGVSGNEELLPNILDHLVKFKEWSSFETKVEICKHKNNAGMIGALYNFQIRNNSRRQDDKI